jgi:hypothetical protein
MQPDLIVDAEGRQGTETCSGWVVNLPPRRGRERGAMTRSHA